MQLTRNVTRVASITTTTAVKKLRSQVLCNHIYSNRKTLWTAATCSDPDLSTALSRCLPTANKANTTASLSNAQGQKDSITIILASRSYPGSDLLSLPSKLPDHVSKSSFILGAVVDRVPTKSGHGVSTLTLTPDPPVLPTNSLDPTDPLIISCQPFYLSGPESRRKRLKEKSVGKWARPQDIEERSLDTADAWSAFKSISTGRNQVQVPRVALPSSSSSFKALSSPSPLSQDIFMISDLEVHQFLEALDTANPDANKLGILASSTPFITGKPVTMFYDGKIVQDGVLGVSIIKSVRNAATVTATSRTSISYPSMAPLGPAMRITRCRGNIILELDESNATRLLLDRLQTTTLTKDKEYFLATGEITNANQGQHIDIDMQKATVYKITGGDPAKGNMAVDTVHDLSVGQWVQFIHHEKPQAHGHYDSQLSNTQGSFRFSISDPNNTIEEQSQSPEQNQKNTDNTFISNLFGASSENGFIVGQPNSHTWVCAVTDSVLTFLK